MSAAAVLAASLLALASADRGVVVSTAPFVAEGVAMLGADKALVSGVAGRTILIVDDKGARPWLKPGIIGPIGGVFGLAYDAQRQRLWAAETFGAWIPGGDGAPSTGLIGIDARTGVALRRFTAPADSKPRQIGDVIVARDGTVYATDSRGGAVYRLRPDGEHLELLAETGLKSPQGLAEASDGALILLNYGTGLHRLDIRTGALTAMTGEAAGIRGLDGLRRVGDSLLVTQNGASRQRLIRIQLNPAQTEATDAEILDETDSLEDVALGDVAGDRFVFVCNSQWAAFGDDGRQAKPPTPARLCARPLQRPKAP